MIKNQILLFITVNKIIFHLMGLLIIFSVCNKHKNSYLIHKNKTIVLIKNFENKYF